MSGSVQKRKGVPTKKYEVLQELDKGTTQKDLTEKYSIPKNTISTWKKLGQ